MKKMSRKNLVQKIKDGMAEVEAWGRDERWAQVRFYKVDGRSKVETVEMSGTWPAGWGGAE